MTNTTQAQRNRANRSTTRTYIEAREVFRTCNGNVSGKWVDSISEADGWGSQLPGVFRDMLSAAIDSADADAAGRAYVVYSYNTPIGWWTAAAGWYRPAHYYSSSTSQHQGAVPLGEAQIAQRKVEAAEIEAYREARARRSAQLAAQREARAERKAQREADRAAGIASVMAHAYL